MACGESTGELDPATVSSEACATAPIIESQPSSLPTHVADNEDENMRLNSPPPKKEKDPRKVARKYQLELCKKAMEENVIVYLGTGCGKTHIAVLLIYELGHLIRKPGKNVCVFLAPTVPLVQQQARVIEESVDFKVGTYYGGSRHLKTHGDWEKQLEQYEVLVMTPEILLRNLHHCFIKMELIALLIFDECHHAQVKSNHPYAQIMKVFYETDASKLPRIFGMTASPVVGKGASDQANLPKSINSLENLLNAKVYSVEDKEELESFVASPVFRVYDYGPVVNEKCSPSMIYCTKLEEIKQQCMSTLKRQTDDQQYFRSMKKQLTRMHENLLFCLGSLGLWGALQASRIASTVDHCERKELMEEDGNFSDDSLCDTYLTQAAEVFASDFTGDGVASDLSSIDVLKEPFFSRKLLRLIGILSSFRLQPNMKCIIFVNRIITAISLSYILQNLKFLASWKCHFLIGVHAGLKSMSRKTMNVILEKFQSGELNLLVATKVGEEGLDIQTCCLVVRFDLPETVASFIQSRGRARMPQSEYAFLVDSGNEKEINLIENFKRDEDRMNVEIVSRTSDGIFARFDERIYKVDSTGASISPGYSISLLHHYCSLLPHDEYFDPKPKFYFFDDLDGTVCHIVLPSNAPIRRIVSTPQASIEAAKKDACLTAVEQLHKLGVLNDYLLPEENDADKEETILNSFDPDSSEEEELRGELYEMIVPAVLKGPWSMSDGHVNLCCYYIKFIPDPDDRIYRKFGLFLKAPLPVEAEEMELDLHLARRRSVTTRLIRAGFTEFSKDEITQAQNFQQMFFKVILDRSELIAEFVPSERNFFSESSSPTFYLLLPVILSECESTVHVDWQIVRRCLSSPMFKTPADPMEQEVHPSGLHLQLANGCWSITDVENSLVYAPHKKQFFFTTHVVHDRNAYGPFKESSTSSHMEHLFKTFSIRLKYPEQPLLQAKPLFGLRNLLHNRKPEDTESQELEEFFIYVPPELFQLKIIGFSKDIGSSLSLLPSIMHRLENLLVAIELKHLLSASFPEGAEVTALRVLEALTTEKCQERFSLERLELLGDAFLKFAVGRHLFLLHDTLDEGELTRKRSNAVNNSNLFKLATRSNIQVYIRDQSFEPCHFFAWGRPCPVICNEETEGAIHSPCRHSAAAKPNPSAVRCSKGHLWLCKKTIADVVEALVGAFIVDSGFKAATAFLRWIGIRVDFEASQVIKACSASKIYMPLAASMDVTALESLLGYQFHHKGLLLQAFVHPSYSKHGGGCYQRLEFLGDAVLDYLITSYLFSVYPKLKPGQLTDLRSVSVNNKAFADVAVNQSFHKFLFCDSSSLSIAIEKYAEFVSGPASESNHFEGPKCPKVLGDLVESCLGAILLDSGFNLNCVWKIMLSFLDPIRSFSSLQLNPVRELQELCQSHDWDLQFSASKKGGIFFVEAKVTMTDDSVAFSASSASKKDATKIASQLTFAKLKGQGYVPKTKSLKEVLMSSVKMEAKLIGYDETPTDVMASIAPEFENLKLEGPFGRDINPNGGLISEPTITRPSCIIPIGKLPSSSSGVGRGPSSETTADPSSETHIQTTGGLHKGSAKSRLSEVCVANCWKAPVYECCEEEGPSHLKLFTYKVILEIDEAPDTTVECFGEPKTKKKVAAEHAAEGALWYLEHQGYLH